MFNWEEDMLEGMQGLLNSTVLKRDKEDKWLWLWDESMSFYSNSAYRQDHIFKSFWKSKVSSKVLAFS